MSDVLSILKTIEAPNLTESNYGENIQQQFENIDSNFQKLGNRDFVKGEKGADLGLEQITLISNGLTLTELGAAVFNVLLDTNKIKAGWLLNSDQFRKEFNSGVLEPILDINWYDYFVKDGKPDPETSTVSVFYRAVNPLLQNSKKEYIGSPIPLVFIDARFTSDTIQDVKSTNTNYDIYLDIVDKSCALYIKYDNGWKVEKVNQFPTLYYEDSMFKWKLFSKKSGIRAQGIRGLDGQPGRVWIGLADAKNVKDVDLLHVNSAYVPIEYVMSFYNLTEEDSNGNKSTWITPEEAAETKHGGLRVGDTIIMIPKIDITNRLSQQDSIGNNMLSDMLSEAASSNNQIWISIVQKGSKGQYITYFSNENLINVSVGNTWMRETMMKAGDDNFKVTKGLFLRLKPNGDENELRAHLLYAIGATGEHTDLHLRPVKNLDDVNSKSLDNCSLSVEDYKNVNVKATSVLDLLGDKVNIKATNTESSGATISIRYNSTDIYDEEEDEHTIYRGHSVDICGEHYCPYNDIGSINMWGSGYIDKDGHYSIGPSGVTLNNKPDVSVVQDGTLRVNKNLTTWGKSNLNGGLNVKGGANIDNRLKVTTRGVEIKHSIELLGDDDVATPYIDFHYDGDRSDYTSRIIENNPGNIQIPENFEVVKDATFRNPVYIGDNISIIPGENLYAEETIKSLYSGTTVSVKIKTPTKTYNSTKTSYGGEAYSSWTKWSCGESITCGTQSLGESFVAPTTTTVNINMSQKLNHKTTFTIQSHDCKTSSVEWKQYIRFYLYDKTSKSRIDLGTSGSEITYSMNLKNETTETITSRDVGYSFSAGKISVIQGHQYILQYTPYLTNIVISGGGIGDSEISITNVKFSITKALELEVASITSSSNEVKTRIYKNGILVAGSKNSAIGFFTNDKSNEYTANLLLVTPNGVTKTYSVEELVKLFIKLDKLENIK